MVQQKLYHIEKYGDLDNWQHIGVIETAEIKEHLGPLIIPGEEDEMAKRLII